MQHLFGAVSGRPESPPTGMVRVSQLARSPLVALLGRARAAERVQGWEGRAVCGDCSGCQGCGISCGESCGSKGGRRFGMGGRWGRGDLQDEDVVRVEVRPEALISWLIPLQRPTRANKDAVWLVTAGRASKGGAAGGGRAAEAGCGGRAAEGAADGGLRRETRRVVKEPGVRRGSRYGGSARSRGDVQVDPCVVPERTGERARGAPGQREKPARRLA